MWHGNYHGILPWYRFSIVALQIFVRKIDVQSFAHKINISDHCIKIAGNKMLMIILRAFNEKLFQLLI